MKRGSVRLAKCLTRARRTNPAAALRKRGAWRKCCAAGRRPVRNSKILPMPRCTAAANIGLLRVTKLFPTALLFAMMVTAFAQSPIDPQAPKRALPLNSPPPKAERAEKPGPKVALALANYDEET